MEVLEASREALARAPDGFTHADMAVVLGERFGRGGEGERRLRRALYQMRDRGVLAQGRRGTFIAGPLLDRSDVMGVTNRLKVQLCALFADHGGVMTPGEIHAALGLDPTGQRALRRMLAGSPEYLQGRVDLWGMGWAVRLRESERRRLPVPGSRLWVDVVLTLEASGRPWRGDVLPDIYRRRCDIGEAVREARRAAGMEIADVLTGALSEALAACLEAGTNAHHGETGQETLAAWWRGQEKRLGRQGALKGAWLNLESGAPIGAPCVVEALDARLWKILGVNLAADPADISRGIRTTEQKYKEEAAW
ncbi:MAG: hypothetical protein Q8Q88_23930 [Phenylobacterium sp.]|nr:hypothetical protein [Phenylobacterium sp.]